MDDPLILFAVLAVSAVSITALVLLNRWLGGWTPARLEDIEAAGQHLRDGVIDFRLPERDDMNALARDGAGALFLETGGDRLGLVLARGDRFICRALRPGEILAVTQDGPVLDLHIADFTLRRARLAFETESEAWTWADHAGDFISESEHHGEPA